MCAKHYTYTLFFSKHLIFGPQELRYYSFCLKDTPDLRIPLSVVCNSGCCNQVTLSGRKLVHTTNPHLPELLWSEYQVHTAKWNESMIFWTHVCVYLIIFKNIDIVALTPYGYNQPCNLLMLVVSCYKLLYKSLAESVLTFKIVVWYGNLGVKGKAKLARIVGMAGKITGAKQDSLSVS